MAQLGSTQRPAIVRVTSREEAEAVMQIAEKHAVHVVVGVEPDENPNLSDLKRALARKGVRLRLDEPLRNVAMTGFVSLFPDVAAKEMRVLRITGLSLLPPGDYALFEGYCTTAGCDCEIVGIRVMSPDMRTCLAQLAIDLGASEEDEDRCVLDETDHAGPIAEDLYGVIVDSVLDDGVFLDRLKRHYAMVRRLVDGPAQRSIVHRPALAALERRAPAGPRMFLFDGERRPLGQVALKEWQRAIRECGGIVGRAAERCGVQGVTPGTRAFQAATLREAMRMAEGAAAPKKSGR